MTLPAGIDATWLKANYGLGINFVDRAGVPFPASFFNTQLCMAADWIEMELGVSIGPKTATADRYNVTNTSPAWYQTRVKKRPIRSVTAMNFRWGNSPNAQSIPLDWIMVRENRLVVIVPNAATPFTPNPGVVWLYGWALPMSNNMVPGVMEITYEYGFDGDELPVPPSLLNALGLKAIQLALVAAGYALFPPGTTNISRSQDGLSQSRGTTNSSNSVLLGAQIKLYQDMLDQQMVTLRAQYGGSVKLLAS